MVTTGITGSDGRSAIFRGPRSDLACSPMDQEYTKMQVSAETLLIIALIGMIAGWLAGQIMHGTGFGLVGNIVVGIVGAFFGNWLLPQLGVQLSTGLVAAIINATIGAVILLFIISLVSRGGGRRWGWGGRW